MAENGQSTTGTEDTGSTNSIFNAVEDEGKGSLAQSRCAVGLVGGSSRSFVGDCCGTPNDKSSDVANNPESTDDLTSITAGGSVTSRPYSTINTKPPIHSRGL
jgi:hypothetical protein